MRKLEDWEIQASTAVNITGGKFGATIKLRGKPFTCLNNAHKARAEIVRGLALLDYITLNKGKGFTQHELQRIINYEQ